MVSLLHPYILHYRESFFKGLGEEVDLTIYCYEKSSEVFKHKFKRSNNEVLPLWSVTIGPFLLYNPFPLLKKETTTIVLMLNFLHLTSWLLLFTKIFHGKKVVMWGHGISVKRYVKEEENPSTLLSWMIRLSDGLWCYTPKEKNIWKTLVPDKPVVSLNNTISDVDLVLALPNQDKRKLRAELEITQEVILMFCARFNVKERRIDLLEAAISALDPDKFGFIVIGEGALKPDLSRFKNVYDFDAVYDREIKNKLFSASDIYFQPGWVGLSIVEAMAYGLPIYTFRRTAVHLQCVEYSYITSDYNGRIFENFDDFLAEMRNLIPGDIRRMGKNARMFVAENLRMSHMITAAASHLESV